MIELRCQGNVLHGVAHPESSGVLEVKCRGHWCGHKSGVVVLHYFDLATGKVLETKQFRAAEAAFNKKKEATARCP